MPKYQKGDTLNIADLEIGMVVKLDHHPNTKVANRLFDTFTDCLVRDKDEAGHSVSFARPYIFLNESGGTSQRCERWQVFYPHSGLNYILIGWAK